MAPHSEIPSARMRPLPGAKNKTAEARACSVFRLSPGSLHVALVDVFVDVGGDDLLAGLHRVAVIELFGTLQIKRLHGHVVLAELEVTAHRLEIGLLHGPAHLLLLGEITIDGLDAAV